MFLVGVIFLRHKFALIELVAGRFIFWLAAYLCLSWMSFKLNFLPLGNQISPILFILLSFTTLSAAYSRRYVSNRLIGINDISYGIYIFHMPVINFMIYNNLTGGTKFFFIALLVTVILGAVSWFLIEKPSLRLKTNPLNVLNK